MKNVTLTFLLITTLVATGFTQIKSDTLTSEKINFPTLPSLELKPSTTISLYLQKLSPYNFLSTCNTCPNRVNNSLRSSIHLGDDRTIPFRTNLSPNYSSINFNPYNTNDVRVAALIGAINLFSTLLDRH